MADIPLISPLPPLPAPGATGDDFNNPAIAFLSALRDVTQPELNAYAAAFGDIASLLLTATSSSSNSVGTGDKTFNIGTGYAFTVGQTITIASRANIANFMVGRITSYTGSDIVVSVTTTGGSGTFADWSIGLAVSGDLSSKLDRNGGTATNLTITGYTETTVAMGTGSSFSPNLSNGTVFTGTTNANATLSIPAAVVGKSFSVRIQYGGAHTLTITPVSGTTIEWSNATVPTPTSASGKADVYAFTCFVAGKWAGFDGGRNIS